MKPFTRQNGAAMPACARLLAIVPGASTVLAALMVTSFDLKLARSSHVAPSACSAHRPASARPLATANLKFIRAPSGIMRKNGCLFRSTRGGRRRFQRLDLFRRAKLEADHLVRLIAGQPHF